MASPPAGPKLEEIRAGMSGCRKSGKRSSVPAGAAARDYYVALAADRIYLGPQRAPVLKGLRAEMMSSKRRSDTLGVSVDVEHAGKYKDYGGHVHPRRT